MYRYRDPNAVDHEHLLVQNYYEGNHVGNGRARNESGYLRSGSPRAILRPLTGKNSGGLVEKRDRPPTGFRDSCVHCGRKIPSPKMATQIASTFPVAIR